MVPVLDRNKKPLMPATEKRARLLMDRGRAKPYWRKGVFCIILQDEPSGRGMQEIVVGIDPGSRFEGFTVKSGKHTLLNVQTDAKTDVKKKMEDRSMNRGARRQRKTPYRKCRSNRSRRKDWIPPSTKARWDWKISIVRWFQDLYPVSHIALENIAAATWKGARKWNKNFSPIEVGKNYFREWLAGEGLDLTEFHGYETSEMRKGYGLKKNSNKSKQDFYTHCVDSWCLANEVVGGHTAPDNTRTTYLKPLVHHKRKLHMPVPAKGGTRRNYGGTMSLGIVRGTLVKHVKHGIALVGGTSKGRISLHDVKTNKRICRSAKLEDIKLLTQLKWNIA